jgi:hypothetical protein
MSEIQTVKTATHFRNLKVKSGKKERSVEVYPEYDVSKLDDQTLKDLLGAQLDIIFCRVHNSLTSEEVRRSWDGQTIQVDALELLALDKAQTSPEAMLQKALARKGLSIDLGTITKLLADTEGMKRAFGL